MRLKIFVNKLPAIFICILSFNNLFYSCRGTGGSGEKTERVPLRVLFVRFPSILVGQSNSLTDEAQTLFSGLEGDKSKCDHAFILDPVLTRVDLNLDTSIITTIEKSGVAAQTAIRDFKIVKEHLKRVSIPGQMLQRTSRNADSLFVANFLSGKTDRDSIIIFNSKNIVDSIKLNDKKFKMYTDLSSIRAKMLYILCQNPKATLVLVVDPPMINELSSLTLKVTNLDCQTGKLTVGTTGGDGSPVTFTAKGLATPANNVFTITKPQRNSKTFTFLATQNGVTSTVDYTTGCQVSTPLPPQFPQRPRITKGRVNSGSGTGDLTMVKGSEGCEVCTRYYSATDNVGRIRQIKESNSTNCCPCGKTIEMRGRTYIMNCNGSGSNRLELVD